MMMTRMNGQDDNHNSNDDVDRISDLPEHLQHHILSHLATEDAVITSALSKHWNTSWKSFPFLDFNFDIFVQRLDRRRGFIVAERSNFVQEFRDHVDESISSRRGLILNPILKFLVAVNFMDGQSLARKLDGWLSYALENNVKDLIIHQYDFNWVYEILENVEECRYAIPQTIFAAKFIQTLDLSGCRMINYSNGVTGLRLRRLMLSFVYINQETLENLVFNSCHLLEELEISFCQGFEVVRIPNCPKLRRASLGCHRDHQIVEMEAPNLVSLSYRGDFGNLERILMGASMLKTLKELELRFMYLTYNQLFGCIGKFPLEKLKLEFCCMNLESHEQMQLAKHVLRMSNGFKVYFKESSIELLLNVFIFA